MRRYTLTVNDSTKVIEIEAVEANLFRVQIDGRLVDVTLEDHRDLAHGDHPGDHPARRRERRSVRPCRRAGTATVRSRRRHHLNHPPGVPPAR